MENIEKVIKLIEKMAQFQSDGSLKKHLKSLSSEYDAIDSEFYRASIKDSESEVIVFNFLDCWLDEANHGFPGNTRVAEHDWPKMALKLALGLRNSGIVDKTYFSYFLKP